jgi:hypothetical protein
MRVKRVEEQYKEVKVMYQEGEEDRREEDLTEQVSGEQ